MWGSPYGVLAVLNYAVFKGDLANDSLRLVSCQIAIGRPDQRK